MTRPRPSNLTIRVSTVPRPWIWIKPCHPNSASTASRPVWLCATILPLSQKRTSMRSQISRQRHRNYRNIRNMTYSILWINLSQSVICKSTISCSTSHQTIWKAIAFMTMLSSAATCRLVTCLEWSQRRTLDPTMSNSAQTWRSLWRICRRWMLPALLPHHS